MFGFVHASLLLAGDILGAYGVMGLILGWIFLRRSDRTVLIGAAVAIALVVVFVELAGLAFLSGTTDTTSIPSTEDYAAGEPDPLAAAGARLLTWIAVTLGGGLMGFAFHAALLLGFWAARRRVLEEPERHVRLLGWWAAVGIPIGWLGALPTALGHLQLVDIPDAALVESGVLFMVQMLTGLFGGLGYAGLFGLMAHWLRGRAHRSRVVQMVAAVGKRSLTSYLSHSLIFAPVLSAWGLGLGAMMSSASMIVFACGVWLVVAVACYADERAGRRGPAEVVLRRLAYGSRRASA